MMRSKSGIAHSAFVIALAATGISLLGGCPGSGTNDLTSTETGDGSNDSGSGSTPGGTQNLPPAAHAQSISTPRDADVCVKLSGGDPEKAVVTFLVVTNPEHGQVTGTPPNVTYTPNPGFIGADSFAFKTSDGLIDSDVATISIDVIGPPVGDGGPIESGQTIAAVIDSPSDSDSWTFSGVAGQMVRVKCTIVSGAWRPAIYLYPPGGGAYVASNNAGSYAWTSVDHQLEATGVYTIVVEDYPGTSTGEYSLSLVNVSTDGGPIQSGETLSAMVDLQGEIDAYTFEGLAGQTVRIRANRADCRNWTPAIWLFPPDGGHYVTSRNSGGGSWVELDHKLAASGRYTILIDDYPGYADFNLRPGVGAYNLSLLNLGDSLISAADPDGGPISAGVPTAGRLNVLGDVDAFTFTGAAGQNVRIQVTRSDGSSWTPAFWLFPPGGGEYVTSTNSGGGPTARRDHQLQATGVYTIVVEDYSGQGIGDYTVAVEQF